MSEKPLPYDGHDEKSSETHKPELSEEGGRRKSVALNIIENPLRVRPRNRANLY